MIDFLGEKNTDKWRVLFIPLLKMDHVDQLENPNGNPRILTALQISIKVSCPGKTCWSYYPLEV